MLMFSDNLRNARKNAGLNQCDVAEKLFVSPQAVGKWERGESTPSPDAIGQMAMLFGVTTDQLIGVDIKNPADNISEAKKNMHELVDSLPDEKVIKLYDLAIAALEL